MPDKNDVYLVIGPVMKVPLIGGGFGVITSTIKLNENAYNLIVKERYRGASPDFDIEKYICCDCGQDYEICQHQDPVLTPVGITFRSVSLTSTPRMGTKITDALSIKTRAKRRHYRWFAFKEGAESRLGHIEKMFDDGYLSEASKNYIMRYFANKKSGDCKFTEALGNRA